MDKELLLLHGIIHTPPMETAARIETGYLLRRLQQGESLSMPHSRPMPSIGAGCHELRVREAQHNWRIVYYIASDGVALREIRNKRNKQTKKEYEVLDTKKRARLEAAGFKTTTVQEFLNLTAEESAMIEVRLALAKAVREARQAKLLSQADLAALMGSSQSRVAKLEAADKSVSIELMLRALFVSGVKPREIGKKLVAL